MSADSFYIVGGTVQAGQGVYVVRHADDDLLALCRNGSFAYILTARQLGKSSLMVRTAERLEAEGTRTALIDLTKLGVQATADAWYLGVLVELADQLGLATDVLAWWATQAHLPLAQRLSRFCTEVVLQEIPGPVVVFVDEIDSTLSLGFTDDFFAAIRALYNARAEREDVRRLTMVLIGVATPGDLIRDPKRTPFNIGTRVELDDFTAEEAAPLAAGFGLPPDEAQAVLGRVLRWTGGHPYLTQRLCRALIEREPGGWDEVAVAGTVRTTFFGEQSERDHNLQFVRDMLLERAPDRIAVLRLYQAVRLGRRPVLDDEQSPHHAHLKLSGVVRRSQAALRVRNSIYAEVFDARWIRRHWPLSWWQAIPTGVRVASGLALGLLFALLVVTALLAQALQISEERRVDAVTAEAAAVTAEAAAEQRRQEAEAARARSSTAEALASDRLRLAQSYTLAARALITLNSNQEYGLRIAIKAAQIDANLITDDALRQSLRASQLRSVFENPVTVNSVAFSPDSSQVVVALADGKLQVWNILSQTLIREWNGHAEEATTAVYSSDGRRIASGGKDDLIRLWNAQTGAELLVIPGHEYDINSVMFSPDSTRIVAADGVQLGNFPGTIRVWNATTGESLFVIRNHERTVFRALYSPDGRHIASVSWDGTLRMWDADNGNELFSIVAHSGGIVRDLAYSPDGRRIASVGNDGTLGEWNASTGEQLQRFVSRNESLNSVAYSPNGNTIIAGASDGSLQIWNVESGLEQKTLFSHEAWVSSISLSSDGGWIASASWDGTVRIWASSSQAEAHILKGHQDRVTSVSYSPDGRRIASASWDGTVCIWDTENGELLFTLPNPNQDSATVFDSARYVNDVVYSPDGRRLATASGDGLIHVWDAERGVLLMSLSEHQDWVNSVIYNPDGSWLISGSRDGTVRVWDAENGAVVRELIGGGTASVAVNSGSTRIAAATSIESGSGAASIVRVWDAGSGRQLLAMNYPAPIVNIVFSPDDSKIAAASFDGTILVYNVENGDELFRIRGHDGPVSSVAYNPDGSQLVSTSSNFHFQSGDQQDGDNSVRVWDSTTGEELHILQGEEGPFERAVFNPDGRYLAVASRTGNISIHTMPTEDLLAFAQTIVIDELTSEEADRLLGGGRLD